MAGQTQWYALHTYSSFENKVRTTIDGWLNSRPARPGRQVVIPLEPVIEIKSGKKHTVMRNLMPGYLLSRWKRATTFST